MTGVRGQFRPPKGTVAHRDNPISRVAIEAVGDNGDASTRNNPWLQN